MDILELLKSIFSLFIMLFNLIKGFWWVLPPIFLFLYLSKKYSSKDIFGLEIITGEFGSGKSYSLSLDTKRAYDDGFFIISNNPNTFVDLYFDNKKDLEKVFYYLLKYTELTNKREFVEYGFRPIIFNVDEAHKYFFARTTSANLNEENLTVLTQIRKRSIIVNFITQELAQIDVFFRRLTNGIIKRYYEGFGFIRQYKIWYVPDPATTSLNEETSEAQVLKSGFYMAPSFLSGFSSDRRYLLLEKWVSNHVIGFTEQLGDYTFKQFLKSLYKDDPGFWEIFYSFYDDTIFIEVENQNKTFISLNDLLFLINKNKGPITFKNKDYFIKN